jgi:hypothetical protein
MYVAAVQKTLQIRQPFVYANFSAVTEAFGNHQRSTKYSIYRGKGTKTNTYFKMRSGTPP